VCVSISEVLTAITVSVSAICFQENIGISLFFRDYTKRTCKYTV
jgi:hypothetical protein